VRPPSRSGSLPGALDRLNAAVVGYTKHCLGTKPCKTSIGNKYLAIRSEHAHIHTHIYIYMVIEEVMFEMRSWQELAVLKDT
jgi:hypothetical protein